MSNCFWAIAATERNELGVSCKFANSKTMLLRFYFPHEDSLFITCKYLFCTRCQRMILKWSLLKDIYLKCQVEWSLRPYSRHLCTHENLLAKRNKYIDLSVLITCWELTESHCYPQDGRKLQFFSPKQQLYQEILKSAKRGGTWLLKLTSYCILIFKSIYSK